MTKEQIQKALNKIKDNSRDSERAHELEDKLFSDFIRAIKNKKYSSLKEVQENAKEVLKAKRIKFTRYFV